MSNNNCNVPGNLLLYLLFFIIILYRAWPVTRPPLTVYHFRLAKTKSYPVHPWAPLKSGISKLTNVMKLNFSAYHYNYLKKNLIIKQFKVICNLIGHKSGVTCLEYHTYASYIASGSVDSQIRVSHLSIRYFSFYSY